MTAAVSETRTLDAGIGARARRAVRHIDMMPASRCCTDALEEGALKTAGF
jgi:hypothetical protein